MTTKTSKHRDAFPLHDGVAYKTGVAYHVLFMDDDENTYPDLNYTAVRDGDGEWLVTGYLTPQEPFVTQSWRYFEMDLYIGREVKGA